MCLTSHSCQMFHCCGGATLPMRNASHGKPHLHTAKRTGEHQIVEIAEVSNTKHLVRHFPEAAAERHIEAIEHNATKLVCRVPSGHQDRSHGAALLLWIAAANFEPPSPHRAARGFR